MSPVLMPDYRQTFFVAQARRRSRSQPVAMSGLVQSSLLASLGRIEAPELVIDRFGQKVAPVLTMSNGIEVTDRLKTAPYSLEAGVVRECKFVAGARLFGNTV